MPAKPIGVTNAEHYTWGDGCDGWHLLNAAEFSVILERMPPGTIEVRHLHRASRQFFFVIEGVLTLEVDHQEFEIALQQGIEVLPGQAHQAFNRTDGDVRFLAISQPHSHGDRMMA